MHNTVTQWHKQGMATGRYHGGYFIGSTLENGEHSRIRHEGDTFSVYVRAKEPGVTDLVVCQGIQHLGDAERICHLLNQFYSHG